MIDFNRKLYYYDDDSSNRIVEFIESYCTHVRGDKAGEPLLLADFWKYDILQPVFGIKKLSNGKRRFKTCYVEIGKGNAKSTVGSGLGLYLTGFDGAKGASVYSVASDTLQARIIFDTAKFMIEQNPYLQEYFEPYRNSIIKKGTPCFYQVLSGEEKGKHGTIPSAIIFDEVHEQRTRDLWDTITAGQMKIDDSLTIAFTTAGWNKQSICYELHKKAIDFMNGVCRDESFFGIIYSADEKDDISLVKTWKKANPGLGVIITEDNLRTEYGKVVSSPAYENTFRRLHLNQWTEVYEAWLTDYQVKDCNLGGHPDDNLGLECYAGLDLSATRDFNSFTLLFPIDDNSANVVNWFWLPRDMLDQRMLRQNVDFPGWVRDDLIKTIPGNAVDHNIILSDIREIAKNYIIKGMGYDRKFASPIVIGLSDIATMDAIDQTLGNVSYPTKVLEKLVLSKQINLYGNPVMEWMFANVAIYRGEGDLIRVTKKGSQDRVDGVASLINAIAVWEAAKMHPAGSVYDDPNYKLISF